MLRLSILAAALVACATPALAKGDRTARICDETGRCRHVPLTQVRRALVAESMAVIPPAETAANAATNRRQLNALLARLR